MEAFILAAVSLTIAISLIIYKKNDPVQLSFASLCLAMTWAGVAVPVVPSCWMVIEATIFPTTAAS